MQLHMQFSARSYLNAAYGRVNGRARQPRGLRRAHLISAVSALLFFIQDFVGNTDEDTVVPHDLTPPVMARFIRFCPVAFNNHMSMRVEVYGCKGIFRHNFCL